MDFTAWVVLAIALVSDVQGDGCTLWKHKLSCVFVEYLVYVKRKVMLESTLGLVKILLSIAQQYKNANGIIPARNI